MSIKVEETKGKTCWNQIRQNLCLNPFKSVAQILHFDIQQSYTCCFAKMSVIHLIRFYKSKFSFPIKYFAKAFVLLHCAWKSAYLTNILSKYFWHFETKQTSAIQTILPIIFRNAKENVGNLIQQPYKMLGKRNFVYRHFSAVTSQL